MIKLVRSTALAVLMGAALLSAGCSAWFCAATPDPAASPTPNMPTPTIAPTNAPAITPTFTIAPEGYSPSELDGIAGPGDVLPMYSSYEEAVQASIDARGTCEVVGWITIPNTNIDYPVYLNAEDAEYYLDHNGEGMLSKYGAIFMDARNADPAQQQHILIYGHAMHNGTMFHDLESYRQKSFFESNQYITLNWNDVETVWQIYLATPITGYNIRFTSTQFQSGDAFAEFIAEVKAYAQMVSSSIIDDSVIVGPNDQVLTLSTCTYCPPEAEEQGFIVQARRIR